MRNDIAHISRHTHHTCHIFLYEFSIVWQYHSQRGSIIRVRVRVLKFKSRKIFFKILPQREATFFVNASRAICQEQLSRSTILSKLRSITAEPKYRPLRPHNALLVSTFVCPFVSQPGTDLGIRIFASNFPKESVINETPSDIETLDSTKPDRNRDFELPRRDAVRKRVLYITLRVTLSRTLPSETTHYRPSTS